MSFKTKSTAERISVDYEGATLYVHRLLYEQQAEVVDRCTERGETDWRLVQLTAAQEATDGWDEQVHDADDHPIPVPSAELPDEERRQRIATVVSTFPTELIIKLAEIAYADNAETVKKNWKNTSSASSASPTDEPAASSPVPTADASAPTMPSPSPVIEAA